MEKTKVHLITTASLLKAVNAKITSSASTIQIASAKYNVSVSRSGGEMFHAPSPVILTHDSDLHIEEPFMQLGSIERGVDFRMIKECVLYCCKIG